MPWKLEKTDEGYYVIDPTGKRYSKKPLSKQDAEQQLAALWMNAKEAGHTGVMVAIPVPEVSKFAKSIAFPKGAEITPDNEHHVTLAYLGEKVDLKVSESDLQKVCKQIAEKVPPVTGKINGVGFFSETHKEGMECMWASFDAPALPELRQHVVQALEGAGVKVASDHGFTPHVTLAYYPRGSQPDSKAMKTTDVTVPSLRLAYGDSVTDIPFGGKKMAEKAALTKDGLPASSYLVIEDPEKVTTWHLPVKDASGKPDHNLMGAAWAALTAPGGHRGNKYEGPNKQEAIGKLRKLYASENMAVPGESKGFSVYKQADGSYRWVLISSSAFKDRDGETITRKALEEDVDRCDKAGNYGPLRWWHMGGWEAPNGVEDWQTWKATEGVDLGTCDFNMVFGKMLLESGTFKSADLAEAFSEAADNLEVSISFSHPPKEPGKQKVYDNIHRFERSLLPAGMASNLLTKVYVSKGEQSMDTKLKLAALAAILKGKPALAQQILADADSVQKAAEAAGLSSKEVQDMITESAGEEPPAVEEKKPEEAPAAETVEKPAEEVPEATTPTEPEPTEKQPAPAGGSAPTIGSMTMQQLETMVSAMVGKLLKAQAVAASSKEVELETKLSDALASLSAQADKVAALETAKVEQQKLLSDLTDARPVGIKQLQAARPSASEKNVTLNSPAGPQIDQSFISFSQGAKS